LDELRNGFPVLALLEQFLVEGHRGEAGDGVVGQVEEQVLGHLWDFVVVSVHAVTLNRGKTTFLKRKKIMLRPELKLSGLDFVPREYFFWM
jgi:hypothetical protein